MYFEVKNLAIDGLRIIRSKRFEDYRGYFVETWSQDAFRKLGIEAGFVQDNQSLSVKRGTLRGLHFQLPPHAQAKLVRVIRGAIFDVTVDMRTNSPHYGKWCGITLSEAESEQLFVPRGFAHGFVALEPKTIVAYRVDAPYAPSSDSGIYWNDPKIGIEWPLSPSEAIVSPKDLALPPLAEFASPFRLEAGMETSSGPPGSE